MFHLVDSFYSSSKMSSSRNSKEKLHCYNVEVLLDVSKRVEEVGDLFIPQEERVC